MGEVIRIFFFTLLFLFSYTNAAHSTEENLPLVCSVSGNEEACEAEKKRRAERIKIEAQRKQAEAIANTKKEQDEEENLDTAARQMKKQTDALAKKLRDEKKKCIEKLKRLGEKDAEKKCSAKNIEQRAADAEEDQKVVDKSKEDYENFCLRTYGKRDCKRVHENCLRQHGSVSKCEAKRELHTDANVKYKKYEGRLGDPDTSDSNGSVGEVQSNLASKTDRADLNGSVKTTMTDFDPNAKYAYGDDQAQEPTPFTKELSPEQEREFGSIPGISVVELTPEGQQHMDSLKNNSHIDAYYATAKTDHLINYDEMSSDSSGGTVTAKTKSFNFNDPANQFGDTDTDGGDAWAQKNVQEFAAQNSNTTTIEKNVLPQDKPFEPDYNLTEREGFKPVKPLQEVADGNAKGPPVPLPVKKPDTTVTPTKVVTRPVNNGGVGSNNDPKNNNNGNVAQNGGVNAGQQNGGGAQNNNTGGNGQQGNAGLGGGGFNNGGNNGAVNTALNNQNSSLNNLNQKIGNFKSQNSVDGTSSRKQKTSQKRQPVLSQRQNDPESEQPEDNVDRAQRSRDGKSSRDRRVASLDPGALKRGYGSAGKASVNPDEEEEAGLSAEEEANEKMKANEGFISAGLSKLKSLFSSRKRSWGEKASIYGSKNKKKKKKVSSSDLDSARAILNRKLQEGQGKILGVRGIASTQTGITGSDMSIFKSMCLSYHNYQVNNDIHMGQTWCPKK